MVAGNRAVIAGDRCSEECAALPSRPAAPHPPRFLPAPADRCSTSLHQDAHRASHEWQDRRTGQPRSLARPARAPSRLPVSECEVEHDVSEQNRVSRRCAAASGVDDRREASSELRMQRRRESADGEVLPRIRSAAGSRAAVRPGSLAAPPRPSRDRRRAGRLATARSAGSRASGWACSKACLACICAETSTFIASAPASSSNTSQRCSGGGGSASARSSSRAAALGSPRSRSPRAAARRTSTAHGSDSGLARRRCAAIACVAAPSVDRMRAALRCVRARANSGSLSRPRLRSGDAGTATAAPERESQPP